MKPYNTDRSKKEEVRTMFDRIAPRYDLLNHTLSGNIDRLWRRHTVQEVQRFAPQRILDLATGTGDLAIALAKAIPSAEVVGIDLSEQMLDVARRKVAACGLTERVRLEVGEAERLTCQDDMFDVATVAFGVRNFDDLEAGLRELWRTIKPGGAVVILEFSRPRNRLFRALYECYANHLLPLIGGWISRERKAYDYLPRSVSEFPAPGRFMELMGEAGFVGCRARSQSFGIAQIYIGRKPTIEQ